MPSAAVSSSPLTRSIFAGRRQTFGLTGRALWWSGTSRCRALVGHGGTPALLGEIDGASLIRDLAEHMSEWDGLERRLMAVVSSMACHGSVRAGRRLKPQQMSALLREMEATPNSGQCNHDRPTYVELKLTDIERLVGRR
jgi:DNA mismatch repair ATPase MutL